MNSKRTTIKEIAKAANVSCAATSMALNGKPGVSSQTRARILKIAEDMHYFANINARALKTNKSGNIGLIVTDLNNPFFSSLASELNSAIEARGYSCLIAISDDRADKERQAISRFVSIGIDGIIIVPPFDQNMDQCRANYNVLRELSIPIVFCTIGVEGFDACAVQIDLAKGACELVKHLLSRGCRHIAMVTSPLSFPSSRLRYEGYKRAYEELSDEFSEGWIHYIPQPTYKYGYDIARSVWATRPDAIITMNDFVAMGIMKALHEMDVRVPLDVSVAGYDDIMLSAQLSVPLTTVRQPVADIALHTVGAIMKLVDGEPCEQLTLLDPVLKVRNTTR